MVGNETINGSSPQWDRKAAMDKAVNDIFDELITEVSAKTKLHPSEQFNKTNHFANIQNNAKLYDFINHYHAFCRLCEQHFYIRSFPNDINSFFQKHINTPHHRQLRAMDSHPDDVPILTWEEPLHSGRCHVCDLSGLDAFVIFTRFSIKKIMQQHMCVWSWEERETNDRFVKKLSLLKKYCGLKVFERKFLKTIDGRVVCLLCGVSLSWSEEKARCHLKSDLHYQKFSVFVWMNFSFAPKDILNGYNLETVTRWLLLYEPPLWNKLADLNELSGCISETNNFKHPYPEDRRNMSYSPAYMGMLLRDEEVDFVYKETCLLCGVMLTPGHFATPLHRAKALDPGDDALNLMNYMIYIENRGKRLVPHLRIIDRYERLLRDQKENMLFLPILFHYIKWMFAKKLPLLDKVIIPVNDREVFCHVCDQYLEESLPNEHLNSAEHNNHLEKWDRLLEDYKRQEFLECFKVFKNVVMCLLCGTMIHTNSFFAHLKSSTHTLRLKLYMSLNLDIPMSLTLEFLDDFTCRCIVCNSHLGTKNSFTSTLRDIRAHWPCPKFEDARRTDSGVADGDPVMQESEGSEESKDNPVEHRIVTPEPPKEVVGAVESIASAMDQNVEDVLENSPYLRSRLKNKRGGNRQSKKKVLKEPAPKRRVRGATKGTAPPASPNPKPSPSVLSTGDNNGESSAGEEKKPTTNELRNNSTEDDNTSEQEEEEYEVKEEEEYEVKEEEEYEVKEEENEVLLIRGLPKKKRKCKVLYCKLQSFGKIRYAMFTNKVAIVAFVERGVANVAAVNVSKAFQLPDITVEVTERKSIKKLEDSEDEEKGKEKVMPNDLRELLENPRKLERFIQNLDHQSSAAGQAKEEAKKEQIVCNMVVRAVLEWYPRARCYPFGSRLTGMSLSNSDLDVFVDCGGMYDGSRNTTPNAERRLVRTMADALRNIKDVTEIFVVERARVPIISFRHKPTETRCDLSFKNGLGVQNSLLIKFLTTLDWRVKPIILFLKHWAMELKLHGPPYFSSYALSMLVINYLEQVDPPVLPTIESLQDSYVGRRSTIGGWDCSINTNNTTSLKPTNDDTLLELLQGFFEYYEKFDFSKNVVFPLTGKALPREAFSESGKDKLPLCFKRSILNLPVPLENLVGARFPICVVDPFDLSHVLTKSFNLNGLMQFVYFCQMSRQYLTQGMAANPP